MPKRVLVADDSPTIRKIVQVCLAGAEVEFIGVSGGEEAVVSLKAGVPDLVLADTVMPSPDGYALCERIKKGEFKKKKIPVVLMADPFVPFDSDRAIAARADGNITKPFDAKTLLGMIGDQLGDEIRSRAMDAIDEKTDQDAMLLDEVVGDDDRSSRPIPGALQDSGGRMSPAELDALARRVVRILSDKVVRDVAWEVVPELSELLIRERLQKR